MVQLKIVADVWVNGSYLSEKQDPDDIDVVVKLDFDFVSTLDSSAGRLIDAMARRKLGPELDSYVFINYPIGHPRRGAGVDRWTYWAHQWSVARGGWCKGVAVLRLGESDVGLRLFA